MRFDHRGIDFSKVNNVKVEIPFRYQLIIQFHLQTKMRNTYKIKVDQ